VILGWALAGLLFLVILECRTRIMEHNRAKLPAAIVIDPDEK
jgi:hypothetical protein